VLHLKFGSDVSYFAEDRLGHRLAFSFTMGGHGLIVNTVSFVALCSSYVSKIIKFGRFIHLLPVQIIGPLSSQCVQQKVVQTVSQTQTVNHAFVLFSRAYLVRSRLCYYVMLRLSPSSDCLSVRYVLSLHGAS